MGHTVCPTTTTTTTTTEPCSQWCPFFACLSVTLHIVNLYKYYIHCIRSGVTLCIPSLGSLWCLPLPYLPMMVTPTRSVLWSHIGILKHRRRTFIPLSVSAKTWANAFLLAIAACSIFVFYCFPFRSIFLLVGIVGLVSSDK